MAGYVYIMTNQPYGTLYTGSTGDLLRRVGEHKAGAVDGFTKRYKLDRLVYYEGYGEIVDALERELRIKRWRRRWKIALIERANPTWADLAELL